MPVEFIQAIEDSPSDSVIERLATHLREDRIVALPTETVYGVAARFDHPAAVEKLKNLKGRGENHPFTVHLPDRESLSWVLQDVPVFAERLMNRYWPGPLTLVLPDGKGGLIGVRVPAKELTREILRRVGAPVVMSSANTTGKKPAVTAEEVHSYFPTGLEAIVNSGPCAIGEASTVVQISGTEIKVLREGILSLKDLQKIIGKRVVFVCTGNTCRSPMAEGLLKAALAKKYSIPVEKLAEFGYRIHSAGIVAMQGSPASDESIKAMKEIGVDISKHRSRPLQREQILECDSVYVMGQGHLTRVQELAPQIHDRLHLLEPSGKDIADPFGSELDDYRACRDQIQKCVEKIAQSL